MKDMYPYSKVFYKTDDSPGWNAAVLYGDEELAKQKASQLWKTFKIFSGSTYAWKQDDVYPAFLDPETMHMTSLWIYSNELQKYFFPDEEIPVPKSGCMAATTLKISFDMTEHEDNEVSDLTEFYLETLRYDKLDEVQIATDIIFETDTGVFKWCLRYSDAVYAQFKQFLSDIISKNFAHIIFEEYEYIKLLAWNTGSRIRIKIQDYDFHDVVKEPLEFEIEKDSLVLAIEKFLAEMTKIYEPLNTAVRENAKNILIFSPDYDQVFWSPDGTGCGNWESISLENGDEIELNNHELKAWLEKYVDEVLIPCESGKVSIEELNKTFDWESFHKQGLELAKKVKELLPKDIPIIYRFPFEDKRPGIKQKIVI